MKEIGKKKLCVVCERREEKQKKKRKEEEAEEEGGQQQHRKRSEGREEGRGDREKWGKTKQHTFIILHYTIYQQGPKYYCIWAHFMYQIIRQHLIFSLRDFC